jgi:hypothetical protein
LEVGAKAVLQNLRTEYIESSFLAQSSLPNTYYEGAPKLNNDK